MKNFLRILLFSFVGFNPMVYSQTNCLDNLKLKLDLGSHSSSMPELKTVMKVLFGQSSESESPLNIVHDIEGGDEGVTWAKTKSDLLTYLDRPETTLVLLEGKDDGRGYQPERGESTETNWVFSLVIPSLSDHIFWIVIPKAVDSKQAPYVYGFN